MEIKRSAKPAREKADVKLWYCVGCGVVHLSVKDFVLNFPREEFAAFTESVVEIHYSGWESADPFSVIDLGEHDADFHANATVH
jgi:hypothetical protein